MAPTCDMNWKANQAALLRSPLLSRTNINAKHNHSASSTSTATSSSSPEEPRTSPDKAAGVIDHGKELDDIMQTKGVNLSAISSSFSDVSVTRVHTKSLLARITRTNTTKGPRVANECLEGVMSTSRHASTNVSEIKIHRESMLARIARVSVRPHGGVKGDVAGRSEIFGPDQCSSLTAFIWRTNNSLTAQRYWVGGLKNPAVFHSIMYLLRMLPAKIPITSVETMKHAFAGLGTPNFAVLERLALQVVDYDMLVHNGDWADCSGRLRKCMRVLTSKESQEAVGGWLDVMEVCPAPRTALKRSGCIADMDKARLLLKALDTPKMADSCMAMEEPRMTARERQAVDKVRRYEGHSATCQRPPSWLPALSDSQSLWVPPSAVARSRAYAYPYA
ncbi:hypothetical protein CPB85DRAFT_1354587 [Mucidula mucida]|nr:hypothetical protein CPB85DRAFT_1354587 [Mucidula mucida]